MGNLFTFLGGTNEERLFQACRINDVATAKQMIEALTTSSSTPQTKLDGARDSTGKTALMIAAENGSIAVIDLLVARGASVDMRSNETSSTALHLAAGAGQRDACLALIDRGADPIALDSRGFTPVDVARLKLQCHVLRALERRTALFYGWLKWERSSMVQAGLGKIFGPSVKEAMQKKFGGEWRENYVVVTKLIGKSSNVMMCPKCRGQFADSREAGTRIRCPQCSADLHVPHTPVVSILEMAIYASTTESRPLLTLPLNVMSVDSEFRIPEMRMSAVKLFLQRPAEAPYASTSASQQPNEIHGVVSGSGKDVLWAQAMLTLKAGEVRSTKKVVFAVDENLNSKAHLGRFVAALRASPQNSIAFAAGARNPETNLGSADVVVDLRDTGTAARASTTPPPPPPRSRPARASWACPLCTLLNSSETSRCSACDTPRDAAPLDLARMRQQQSEVSKLPNARGAAVVVPPPPTDDIQVMLPVEDDERDLPAHFLCPITGEMMQDPVVASDGMSYERRAIEAHIRDVGLVSPVTMLPLDSAAICPNTNLKRAIERWEAAVPVASLAMS